MEYEFFYGKSAIKNGMQPSTTGRRLGMLSGYGILMEDGGICLEVSLEWRIPITVANLTKNSDSCSFDLNNWDDHGILLVYHRKKL